jgi:magnesium-transporting ATPase (P-type)
MSSSDKGLHGLLAGLTLAMAILPEELPVVLTLFLGLGAWRLAREKVLARSIPAVKLLGATTVLCVDKTGTLTANRMTVRRLWTTTAAYDTAATSAEPLPEELHGVLECAVLASHRRAFDPMDTAIGEAGKRLLADTEHLRSDWTLVDDYAVAREAAALVLLDDDDSSLVTTVRQGHRVFANLRKAVVFVVAVHVPIVGLSIVPVLFGWPMLLMPVHILFLQLIIDSACSVVFEAEALEPDAMRLPPRRPDQKLFDKAVMVRGLWQGSGLLLLLLAVYAGARAWLPADGQRDDIARALTFVVLILSNLGLIHANRSWGRTSLAGNPESNKQFGWIAAGGAGRGRAQHAVVRGRQAGTESAH